MFPKNPFNSPDDLVKAVTEIMTGKAKKEALDPVDAKALKGSHADRKDKDIDNDGDVDSSDKYLHNRRKAVKKAMNEAKVKENEDEDDMEDDDDEKTDAQKNDLDGDGKNDKKKKKKKDDELSGKPDKINTKPTLDDTRTMMAKEEVELDEEPKTLKLAQDSAVKNAVSKIHSLMKVKKISPSQAYSEWERGTTFGLKLKSQVRAQVRDSLSSLHEMSDVQMKKREEIVKSMKDKTADFKKRYGDRWKDVMYATATKQAMKEEVELDENYRQLALKGIGAETPNTIKVGHGVDYYSPKDGSKHMGKITKVGKTDYELKDDKTGKTYKFKYWSKNAMKEEMDEARGRPKKEDDVSSDSNFVMQMRKAISLNGNKVNFLDGSSSQVSSRDAQQFMTAYNKQKSSIDKGRLMKSAHKSLKHFKMALQGKIEKPKNPLDLD
jgi:hypothetical protein